MLFSHFASVHFFQLEIYFYLKFYNAGIVFISGKENHYL